MFQYFQLYFIPNIFAEFIEDENKYETNKLFSSKNYDGLFLRNAGNCIGLILILLVIHLLVLFL